MGASQKSSGAGAGTVPRIQTPYRPPGGRLYGGAMVLVHPHYTGRAVARFSDNRGLGRYAAITLREKRDSDHVHISIPDALD